MLMKTPTLSRLALMLAMVAPFAWITPSLYAQASGTEDVTLGSSNARRVGDFLVALRPDTQTLARLSPTADPAFSFTPLSRETERARDGYDHLGDLHLRVRGPGGNWRDFDSSRARQAIQPQEASGTIIAKADITATMGTNAPFSVERTWADIGGHLVLRFQITNRTTTPLELGIIGVPMVFDNILTGRTLDEAHVHGSFVDPYIGRDAGYLQVTRLNDQGPTLLVLPEKGTPLEAYVPMTAPGEANATSFTDLTPRSSTFEGFYDWTVHSIGYANREWRGAGEQWNTPTGRTLAPGQSLSIGFRFVQSLGVRSLERTLSENGQPVAVGIPGYILPMDQQGHLFIKARSAIVGFESYPAGAVKITPAGVRAGWTRWLVSGQRWGRVRLTIRYADGAAQTVSYFLAKPLEQVSADLGRFSTTSQWYEDPRDPFHRSPAILSFDRDVGHVVLSDHRVWIPGLSDEGGAGSWVAATVKQLDNPDPAEIAKIERFVDETLVGKLQIASGEHVGAVKKSLFWFDPARFPSSYPSDRDPALWRWSWDKREADRLDRSYNYPHVAVAHWVLYRLARNHPGLMTRHDWRWYLDHAYQTAVAMSRDAGLYTEYGLMEGNVFVDILTALKREGLTDEAANLERLMRARADHWRTLKYPFGSEMPWDSTGQPEVYAWMRYFGFTQQAEQTREVILGYDPAIASWGYNGNARRYWDFGTAGKLERVERQIHHYGSALNAVPLLDAYRRDPSDLYLLRVGYGGTMGPIANIDRTGFSSTAFHAWPDVMNWDAYSGDFGMGFFGHAYAAATYLVDDPRFGWLGFGGNVTVLPGNVVRVVPKDGARSRLFVAPAGQWITLEAGKIRQAEYSAALGTITLTLDPADRYTPRARIVVAATIHGGNPMAPRNAAFERDGYTLPLGYGPTIVTLENAHSTDRGSQSSKPYDYLRARIDATAMIIELAASGNPL